MKNALIYLVVFMAIQVGVVNGVQALWQLISGSTDITAMMLIVASGSFSIITMAVFLLARWATVSRDYVRSRQWAVLFWCVMAALGAIIPSAWLQEHMPQLPNLIDVQLDMVLRERWGYIAVGLLAPLAEELVFRGAILRVLLRQWESRRWMCIAVSALVFSLAHGNPAQMPHAFIVGLLLGWMYCRTGSIVPGVAYHWVNNSVAYVMYNIIPDADAPLVMYFGSETRVLMALLCSLCILLPALFQLNVRMKKANLEQTVSVKKANSEQDARIRKANRAK